MKYTVTFSDEANDNLASIYLSAPDKRSVTRAAHLLERQLQHDAHEVGREYEGNRMLRIDPLLAFFAVCPDDCLVEVMQLVYLESP